ncbi:MAG TPA: PrsW family glutamic-type intramembrane protease [Solirubrobacter sp.]|nr:PrsW family glutamic-type intramembrane protease [Solirubrobacter sp.]
MSSDTRGTSAVVHAHALPRRLWLYALAIGLVVLLVAAFITEITEDTILIPNVIIVGSFLVPVCAVLFVLALPRETHMTVEVLVLGFLAGGTAGVVLSAVTEVYLLPEAVGTNAVIGFIEEASKILILVAVAQLVSTRVPRDGMVLGVTVGAGFAAFETSGYVLRVLIEHGDDHSILSILETEAFRGALAPFGHITWTAVLGGAVFASAWATGRFRFDRRVGWTLLGVVALHGFWDASYGWAIRVSNWIDGHGLILGWPNTADWIGFPTSDELTRFTVVYDTMLGILSLIGIVWAIRRWRAYRIDRWSSAHPRSEAASAKQAAVV